MHWYLQVQKLDFWMTFESPETVITDWVLKGSGRDDVEVPLASLCSNQSRLGLLQNV